MQIKAIFLLVCFICSNGIRANAPFNPFAPEPPGRSAARVQFNPYPVNDSGRYPVNNSGRPTQQMRSDNPSGLLSPTDLAIAYALISADTKKTIEHDLLMQETFGKGVTILDFTANIAGGFGMCATAIAAANKALFSEEAALYTIYIGTIFTAIHAFMLLMSKYCKAKQDSFTKKIDALMRFKNVDWGNISPIDVVPAARVATTAIPPMVPVVNTANPWVCPYSFPPASPPPPPLYTPPPVRPYPRVAPFGNPSPHYILPG